MSPEQIEKIAGEPEGTQKVRTRLNEELEKLRKGKESLSGLNTFAMRARNLPSMRK